MVVTHLGILFTNYDKYNRQQKAQYYYSQLSANWHPCKRTVLLMNTFFTFNFCLPVKSTFLSITLHIPVSRNSLSSRKKVAYIFPLTDIHSTFLSCHLWESGKGENLPKDTFSNSGGCPLTRELTVSHMSDMDHFYMLNTVISENCNHFTSTWKFCRSLWLASKVDESVALKYF